MPREWQHHNGEDYDDLFDRMRAGFAFDEVQEPAIDQQLAWFQRQAHRTQRHAIAETDRDPFDGDRDFGHGGSA